MNQKIRQRLEKQGKLSPSMHNKSKRSIKLFESAIKKQKARLALDQPGTFFCSETKGQRDPVLRRAKTALLP